MMATRGINDGVHMQAELHYVSNVFPQILLSL